MNPEYKEYFVRIPIESTESFEGFMNYMPRWGIIAEGAVAVGKLLGKKGGDMRAANLTPEQRSEAARRAANARWHPQQ